MQWVGRRYDTGESIQVTCANGLIARMESAPQYRGSRILSPGFIDLQVNGYAGRDFGSPALAIDDVVAISLGLDRHGVVGYMPTVTTNRFEIIEHAVRTVHRAAIERPEVAGRVLGIHVEGPYISPHEGPRGAHPREHCRPPNWDEFQRWQDAAGGLIKLITLSPEYDSAPIFIQQAVRSGVLIAIGHTSATSAQIAAAVDAGARMSTHLGNGAHPLIRRHPNYIWDQLADDRLVASIIADGHHLPPAVVKCFTRCKSLERIVLVSDITGMGGRPPGKYSSSLGEVEVLDDGRMVVAGQRDLLAGAALPIEYGVANLIRYCNLSLHDAIETATSGPAALLGLTRRGLQPGSLANLIEFELPAGDGPLRICRTYNQGELVFDIDAS